MFTHNRKGVDLNGTWKFCPDPMQRCRSQRWWENPPVKDEYFPCWDPEGLWDIAVPGTWKTQFVDLKWYDGHAVYTRDFDLSEIPEEHQAFLIFDGIVYESEVFLNGQFVGRHEWGYSPFRLCVTGIPQRKNRIFVLVDNRLAPDRVPGERYDWNNDGGIINSVKLIFVPDTYIENFRTAVRLDGNRAVIDCDVFLRSQGENTEEVTVRIRELDLESVLTAAAGAPARATFSVPLEDITLWTPETPRLYMTELSTQWETLRDEIGYREIRTEGRQLLLNGRPVRLYGIGVHSEFRGTGRTATTEGIELMIDRARELGVNFLRCAHYPYAESFGRAMDKAGLMWWQEVPAYWLRNMGEDSQIRKACGMLRETIVRDWNRAGLIIWSVSNECCYRNPENPEDNNYAYWFTAAPMVRELDPTRLVTCAEAGNVIAVRPSWEPEQGDDFKRKAREAPFWQLGHTDEWYALFDILAANMYVNWPGEASVVYRRLAELLRPYDKPLMLSEFGSMSLRDAAVPNDVLGSEERHAALIREAYDVFAQTPEIVGYCPWCLVDIRVPMHWRWYNEGKAVFRYGVCDEEWEKKTVFDAVKAVIAKLKSRIEAG